MLTAEVVAILDQRAADRAADQLEERFGEAARDSGQTFSRVFGDSVGNAGLTTQMRTIGLSAGAELRTGLTSGVADAVQDFNRQFGAMGDVANTAFAGISRGGGMAAVGIAGVGLAAVAAGQQLYQLGSEWDDIADGIALRTGKLGDDLDAIVASVQNMGGQTAAPLATIGDVAGQVSQQLGLTGAQLDAMTKTLAEYQEATRQGVDIRGLGRMNDIFDIDPGDAMGALDDLYGVSTATGIGMNELISTMQKAGKAAQEFGLDFEATAGLVASLDEAGLDFERVAPSMAIALRNFAAAGREPQQALRDTIAEIKALTDAGRDAQAIDIASRTFGRGYIDFFNAIKNDQINVSALNTTLGGTDQSLQEVLDSTKDWSEELQVTINQLKNEFKPAADFAFSGTNETLKALLATAQMLRNTLMFIPDNWNAAFTPRERPDQYGLLPSNTTPRDTTGSGQSWDDLFGVPSGSTPTGTDPRVGLLAPAPGPLSPSGEPRLPAGVGLTLGNILAPDGGWYNLPSTGGASGPKLPDAPVVPNVAVPGIDPRLQMNSSLYSASTGLADAQTAVAEKEARLNQLMQSNVATADDIQRARNDAESARQDAHQAEMRFAEAQQSAFESQNKQLESAAGSLEELGAGLDNDFGISKGLAGIADNIVRFVGSLALAGPMAQMNAISAANPNQGSGLIGYLGSTGALGPQYTPEAIAAATSGLGPAALQPGMATGGAYGGDAALLANVPAGRYAQTQAADLAQGIGDCTSAIEDLVAMMDGKPTAGRSMSTGNMAEWALANGFLPGAGGLGDFRVAFNNSHAQATLPGGTPFNWGSPEAAARRGVGGSGADDPALTSRYYRPMSAALPVPSLPSPPTALDLFSPENTNPALTPMPGIIPGGGGQGLQYPGAPSPIYGPQGALTGAHAAAVGTPNAGGVAPAGGTGDGFSGIGGLPMEGMMAAAGAIPGLGAGAQMGMKLANRAIGQMGRYAGIGVSGLMETFLPAGSQLAGNSWFTKLAGGLSGAKPALPNAAGAKGAPPGLQPPGPIQHGQAAAGKAGDNNSVDNSVGTVEYHHHGEQAESGPKDLAQQLEWRNSGVGH